MNSPIQILRVRAVEKRLGVSRPTIYRWLDNDPTFPRSVKIGSHSVGWVESEINAWLEARIRASRPQVAA
ncbi:helix-turn-helix transcriptional regulator [Burkholderia pseudomallei]|uniref:helix-turn-helix transcriptional regulator n=1 Tax=Burkholderia pseudomallei TaxID=28450 RepID=UPI0007180FBA|nr:AlpA family transcriptional regulator [Burkholderia pseudomallei]